jgi:predicted NBD/HSP70 family sugar kinase
MAQDGVTGSPATRLILAVLRERGATSRTELERLADLSKSTVSEHVRVLLRRGVVVEKTVGSSGHRGRPAHVIDLPSRGGAVLALVLSHGDSVGTGPVQCAVIAGSGEVRAHRRVAGGLRPVERGISELERLLGEAQVDRRQLRGAVLAVPMPLVLGEGADTAVGSDHEVIPGMSAMVGTRPQDRLSAVFGVPALLGNDADLAALGEAASGAGRGVTDVAFVKCVNGAGVGVVRSGRLQTGGRVTAGETEHVQVAGGVPCVCGADSCSGGGGPLALWARLDRWGSRAASHEELTELAAAGDGRTLMALRAFGERLGHGLANLHLLFQPSVIVLEAELGAAYPALAEGVERSLPVLAPPWARVSPRIVLAEAEPSPEVRGAAVAAGVGAIRGA